MELLGARVGQVGGLGRGLAQALRVGERVENPATKVERHPQRSGDDFGGRGLERLATLGVVAQHRLQVDVIGRWSSLFEGGVGLRQLEGAEAVGHGVVELGDEGPAAVGEPIDHHVLPQWASVVVGILQELGDPADQVVERTITRRPDVAHVPVQLEVGVEGPPGRGERRREWPPRAGASGRSSRRPGPWTDGTRPASSGRSNSVSDPPLGASQGSCSIRHIIVSVPLMPRSRCGSSWLIGCHRTPLHSQTITAPGFGGPRRSAPKHSSPEEACRPVGAGAWSEVDELRCRSYDVEDAGLASSDEDPGMVWAALDVLAVLLCLCAFGASRCCSAIARSGVGPAASRCGSAGAARGGGRGARRLGARRVHLPWPSRLLEGGAVLGRRGGTASSNRGRAATAPPSL